MANDNVKKPLKEWLSDFYDDSGKISEIVRNLAFAGIGLIWIFKNSDGAARLLPPNLVLPLKFIVLGLAADLIQYIWRALTNYILYRVMEYKYDNRIITDSDIEDVTMPTWVEILTWLIFISKVVFVAIAYIQIYLFLVSKI